MIIFADKTYIKNITVLMILSFIYLAVEIYIANRNNYELV